MKTALALVVVLTLVASLMLAVLGSIRPPMMASPVLAEATV
jgi:hypothetical protein